MTLRQLDIRWVDLDPTRGAETQKKRPCVILQADMVNRNSATVIVAPILPGHKDWPFAVNVAPSADNGLDAARHINVKQLRAVDISRIQNLHGRLEDRYKAAIQAAIGLVFGFRA